MLDQCGQKKTVSCHSCALVVLESHTLYFIIHTLCLDTHTCQHCLSWHVSTLFFLTRVNTLYFDTHTFYLDMRQHYLSWHFDRKNPPPLGGFSIHYVPWSRAVCKRFHNEMRPSHLVVKSLTHGSWSGNIVNRKPPQGGGVLSIKVTRLFILTRVKREW